MLGLVSLTASMTLVWMASTVLGLLQVEIEDRFQNESIGLSDLIGYVVVAPFFETIFLVLLLNGVRKRIQDIKIISFSVAIVVAALHGLVSPIAFFGTIISFYIFSYNSLSWLEDTQWLGVVAAYIPHLVVNSIAFLALWLQ